MWQGHIIRFIHRLDTYFDVIGVGNLEIMRALRQRANLFMMKTMASNNPLRTKVHGLSMYIYPTTADGRAYLLGTFEPYTTELFRRVIEPGMTVLDIGAQFGYYSLLAAKQGAGKVYAFEPVPVNFELLQRNIHMNDFTDIIHPVQRAVGAKQGLVTMFVYEGSDSHSMYRHPLVSVREKISVECIPLDEFLGLEAVDVIKMDIEGHEPYALQGMKQTIASSNKLILFAELAPEYLRRAGAEPKDYLAQLSTLGFETQFIDEHAYSLRSVSGEFLLGGYAGRYANLYCTKMTPEGERSP
jgi:FkbM family methyltransferase